MIVRGSDSGTDDWGVVVGRSQWSYVGHIVILAVDWSRKWAAGPTKDFSRAVILTGLQRSIQK